MRVRFWGTRGSIAKPGESTVRYGGNTSCVQVESAGGTLVVLDCGTGAHALGQALLSRPRPLTGHLLIGHTHWDHIQGFPFFAPLFVPGNVWHIYGPRGVGSCLRESLSGQMQYAYFPVKLDDLGATLHYHDLVEGTLNVGDFRVTAQYLNHPALTLGYRLEADGASVVYSTDHEPHTASGALGIVTPLTGEDRRHQMFVANADLLIHDAQYRADEYSTRRGWGHSTVEYVVDTAIAANVRQLALFHHDPLRSDAALDSIVDDARARAKAAGTTMGVFAAAEGVEVDLQCATATVCAAASSETARADPRMLASAHPVVTAIADARMLRIVSDAVADDGMRAVNASNPAELASSVKRERPALVLIEQGFANADLTDLVASVRDAQKTPDLPVVLIKSCEDADAHRREADAGVTDWLYFPFSREYVRTRVRAWAMREACRWRNAPPPSDEVQRLAALRRSRLLDGGLEERFERYTRIAAALFDVPIALVTLIDEERQLFKACTGISATQTTRDGAFCAHAILDNAVMQVPDALSDDRFADNPFVVGEPRVRFYAGAPLRLGETSPVGTLCVVDHRARVLDAAQLDLLVDLSKLVEDELRTDRAVAAVAAVS